MALTPYLRLTKPLFDSVPWDQAINGNMDIIDGFTAQFMSVPNFSGSWSNATTYTVGQVALDTSNSSMWVVATSHTSAASPTTFAQDRAAHPSYWNAGSVPTGYMPITGGAFTGLVTLSGPPSSGLHAATKAYVDASIGGIGGPYLPLSGGTINGTLNVTTALNVSGSASVQGNIAAGASMLAGAYYVGTDSSGWGFAKDGSGNHIQQHISGWYDAWAASGGIRTWVGTNVALMTLNGSGGLTIADGNAIKPGGGTWTAPSDLRIKDVLGDYKNGLAAIMSLRPVRYKYKDDKRNKQFIGLVAQEAEATMPEMVGRTEGDVKGKKVDDLRTLDLSALPLALVNAIKELEARVRKLERDDSLSRVDRPT
jgi:hypothetical protein